MIQFIFSLIFAIASAQTPEATTGSTEQAPPPGDVKAKKIVVTGSYIKRIDEEGPSAVVTLKKEDLQKTGLNSVGDVLRDQAVITQVGRESSGGSGAGTSTASLRAFGADSILVLLNGLRLPKIGGGNSVDLNLIPVSALERVEILKDGASATYGSDAVGGVINFITKKDYNKTDANVNFALPEEKGGSRFDATVSSGKATDKWSLMGVLNYRKNEIIYDKDRYYSKMENIFTDGSIYASPGSWIDSNDPNTINTTPGCVKNADGFCTYDFTTQSSGVPDLQQYSALISGSYNITDNLKLTSSHIFTRREVKWRYAPAPDSIVFDNGVASGFGLSPAPSPGGTTTFYYRLAEELGNRNNENNTDSYTGQVALEGKFAPTWDWELSGVYGISKTEDTGVSGYARKDVLQTLASTGEFNPNLPSGSKSDLSRAAVQPFQEIRNTHTAARFITSAPLYNGGDNFGPIAFAAGLSADWQGYFENVDPVSAARGPDNLSLLFGGAGSMGQGTRNFQAAFTEFSLFPTDDVEVQIAGRYDTFSDFGQTFNPKLSVSWQATPKVMFRTSMGTGFRSPNLDSLYAGESFGNPVFTDNKACGNGQANLCTGRQYQFRTRGNPGLSEERSFFYNAGVVLQPKKNWNITVDGWGAYIKDQVGLSLTDATFVEKLVDDRDGAGAGRQYMIDRYGITINRLGNGRIDNIDGTVINLGTSRVAGVDIGVNTQKDARIGKFPVTFLTGMEHTQFFKNSSTTFAEIGPRKNLDVFWKNTLNFGIRHKNQTVAVLMRSVSGGDKSLNSSNFAAQETGYGSVPFYTQYDLRYTYAKLYKGDLSLGVRNVFDARRPIDDTIPVPTRLNTSLYDPSGRTFEMGYAFGF